MHRLVAASLAAGLSVGLATATSAADLGRPAPAPVYTKAPMIAPFSWSGFYAGVQAGYGWSNGDVDSAVSSTSVNPAVGGAGPVVAAMANAVPGDFATSAKGFIGGGTL